ncbi:MAG: Ig-like domain-containing protein [Muribaculaceae bacterium]|nr:Ig-like domain-containing protein [Muribaculaceae bacterium]
MKRTTTLFTLVIAFAMAIGATIPPLPVDLSEVKEATPEIEREMVQQALAQMNTSHQALPARINNVGTVASDLEGCYTWSYKTSSNRTPDPDSATVTGSYTPDVVIFDPDDDAGTIKIAGMFIGGVSGTLDLESYSSPTVKVDTTTAVYTSTTYGPCTLRGVFYSETNQGWYYTAPIFFVQSSRLVWASNVYLLRYIKTGSYAGRTLTPYYVPGSTMVPSDGKNGVMTYTYTDFDYAYPIGISEDENYEVTITNFGGLATEPVHINLAADHTFTAPSEVIFTTSTGTFSLYLYDETAKTYLDVTGTGTEKKLTFDNPWTAADRTANRWYGIRRNGEILYVGGEFAYPPLAPTALTLNHTDDEEIALTANETLQLSIASVQPEGASTDVTWASSDESIATVDENGLVTAQVFDGNALNQHNGNAAPVDNNYAFYPVTITATSTVSDATATPASASVTVYVQSSTKTGIDAINASRVESVKYVNAQGVVSNTPFDGVNIKVTRLSDGTTTTSKVIK